jgi:hypothetical protein
MHYKSRKKICILYTGNMKRKENLVLSTKIWSKRESTIYNYMKQICFKITWLANYRSAFCNSIQVWNRALRPVRFVIYVPSILSIYRINLKRQCPLLSRILLYNAVYRVGMRGILETSWKLSSKKITIFTSRFFVRKTVVVNFRLRYEPSRLRE